jgi:hypothetical protein
MQAQRLTAIQQICSAIVSVLTLLQVSAQDVYCCVVIPVLMCTKYMCMTYMLSTAYTGHTVRES